MSTISGSPTFSIGDLSREFDISTRTLRFYEEKGLLTPMRDGQSRIFSAADRTRLKLILRGKSLGFTLDESADIISMYDPASNNEQQLEALISKIREKADRLSNQKVEIESMLADLTEWEKRSRKSLRQMRRKNS
jgi:DNA-binding transcriptional MerR regulator